MTSKAKGSKTPQQRRSLWRRGKWWFVTGGIAGAGTLLFVLSTSLSEPKSSEPDIAAPDLALATEDGQFRLSGLRGRPLLLYFSFPG